MINDYELIYLYKESMNEAIFERIIEKYRPLIWKNIYKFFVKTQDQDDFYQEAVILLYQALQKFDENQNKTFTKYYELLLTRRFVQLKDKTAKYVLFPNSELIEETYTPDFDNFNEAPELAPLEEKIYQMYFVDKMITKSIAEQLQISEKSVKNAIYRIKCKMKH
ncbi:sigma-70 family RNA polymerase sigma factor [Acholeplasma hippikon]|uniref:RNA polymerase sigma factor SigS n=1 Tax=Acholeplasma hippikon TaxID=264636 RepID=A0A449BKF4_9MOLU|nr:sigma-70 family RNA polymerase sigma factor [Acholeplasma hippikon]VEU82924.1 Stage 0 sporulation protein H [Acholeplasma hippikon]